MDLFSYRPYVAKGDGKCLCPALPKVLRKCRMNGTCTLPAGVTCGTATVVYDRGVGRCTGFPGTTGLEAKPEYSHTDNEYAWLDLSVDERRQAVVREPMHAKAVVTYNDVVARVMAGYRQALEIAEVPAAPLEEQPRTMKFSGLGRPKAGRKKAGFGSRRTWLKAKRSKNQRLKPRWSHGLNLNYLMNG